MNQTVAGFVLLVGLWLAMPPVSPARTFAQGTAQLRLSVYYDLNANGIQDLKESSANAYVGIALSSGEVITVFGVTPRIGSHGERIDTIDVPRDRLFVFAYDVPPIMGPFSCNAAYRAAWGTVVDTRLSDVTVVRIGIRKPSNNPPAFSLPDGQFFTQTSGVCLGLPWGHSVTNDAGIPFWDEFQNLGGVPALGYPVSQRFIYKGFTTQAFQKAVMQWQPGAGIFFLNVFDELHDAGKDDPLLVTRATPRQLDPSFDAGKPPEQIVQDRLALLEANSAIRDRYFSAPDPLLLYGLPTSAVQDMGNAFVIRTQRAVFQQWKVDVPWARAGEVTIANGGDIAKEAGLFPTEMDRNGASVNPLQPQPPS